jgi:hypothetical protein
MASFFETPRGAPWGGAGGASWVYLQHFKDWTRLKDPKNLNKPLPALKAVVQEEFFRQASGKDEAGLLRARTTSWSLTYFLAHKHLDGLVRYYRDLARMPRDLDFDSDTLLLVFARAFDCLNTQRDKADNAKLTKLAKEWFDLMERTPVEGGRVFQTLRAQQAELKTGGVGLPGADKKDDGKQPGAGNNPAVPKPGG